MSVDTLVTGLAVVIPSHHGRVDLLARLLQSLADDRARFGRSAEVVVVDDSPPEEMQRLVTMCTSWSMRYEFYQGNVSQKRNHGATLIQGDVLLFLDSDCHVQPGLLEAHWQSYADRRAAACLGLVTFVGDDNWLLRVIQETPLVAPFASPLTHATVTWGPSANFSMRRSVFEAVGGYDEHLSAPGTGGEDVDLGLRITANGGVIVTASNAQVWHSTSTWMSLHENVRRFLSWGRGDYYLITKHPHLAFWDMPALFNTSCLVTAFSVLLALVKHESWPLFGALVFPLVSVLIFGWWHPDKHATLARRFYRSGSLLVLSVLDVGRFLEAMKMLQPRVVLQRFDRAASHLPHLVRSSRGPLEAAGAMAARATRIGPALTTN